LVIVELVFFMNIIKSHMLQGIINIIPDE